MRVLNYKLLVVCLIAVMTLNVTGCAEDSEKRRSKDLAEQIEEDLNRAEERIDEIWERLDDSMTEEELKDLGREIEESIESGLKRVGRLLGKIGDRIEEDASVVVIDYRDFKQLLPGDIEDMELVKIAGANKSALGIRYSKIEASYVSDQKDVEMDMSILDLGTMKGLARMGFDFIDRKIDKENIDGFERTTKFGGYPGFETAHYSGRHTERVGVAIVENRFVVIVKIEGTNLDKDILENVFNDFSFRRLKKLSN